MSAKSWGWICGAVCLWFIFLIVAGASTQINMDDCVKRLDAQDESMSFSARGVNDLTDQRYRFRRDYNSLCRDYITDHSSGNFPIAFLTSFLALLTAGGVDLQMRRAQKREEEKSSHHKAYAKIIDTVRTQTRTEIIMGDVFKDIHYSNIINRSQLETAIQSYDKKDPDIAVTLGEIAKIVADSKSKDAEEHLNALTFELSKAVPSKTLIRSIWNGLKEILPVLKDSISIAGSLGKLLG